MKLNRSWVAQGALSVLLVSAAATSAHADDQFVYSDGFDYAGCPAGQQMTSDIAYSYSLSMASTVRNVDLTQAKNLWGRVSAVGPVIDFPWHNYFAIILGMNRDSYIAARFTVPSDSLVQTFGQFFHGETLPGPNLTMAVSQYCGDFNPAHAICYRSNIAPGGALTKYKLPGYSGISCPLVPGNTYFVNIKLTDPNAQQNDCNGSTCKITVQNNFSLAY